MTTDDGARFAATRNEKIAAVLALALVFVGLYLSYPRPFRKEPVFTSPRQSVGYELARQWAEHGKPEEVLPLYHKVPADIAPAFTPRDGASRDGKVVPKDFPLVVAMFAVAHKINSNVVPFVNPLMGVLTLIVFALLTWELTRSRYAVWLAGILFATTTSFWNSSAWIYAPDTPAVGVVLLATYAFVRAARTNRLLWYGVGGVACAAAFGFRYDNSVIVGLLWFGFVLTHREQWMRWIVVPIVAALGSIPFAVFNSWMYGSPHSTGYGLAYKLLAHTANIKGRGLLGVSTKLFERQTHIYLLRPEIFALLVAGVIGMVLVVWRRHDPVTVGMAASTVAVTLATVAYAGTRNLTGATAFTVSASFLRYLLPSFALLSIFAAAAAARFGTIVRVLAVLVAVVIGATAMHTSVYGVNGVRQTEHDVRLRRLQGDAVFNDTDADGIVIAQLASKVLWPRRQVLSTALLVRNADPVTVADETKVWSLRPTIARLTDVIARLADQNLHIYLLNDQTWLKPNKVRLLMTQLHERHVTTKQLSEGYVQLFRFDAQ